MEFITRQTGNRHASHERAIFRWIRPAELQKMPSGPGALPLNVCSVQLRLCRRLDSGIVLEEFLVQLDEVLPLIGRLVFREDRLDRAHGLTSAAVDALVRMDVEHRLAFVDAIHWTHLDAGLVLHIDARLGDDVRHQVLPLASTIRGVELPQKPSAFVPESTQCVKHSAELGALAARARPSHWARNRGSSASRNESPNRLKANTARLIANPGKIAIHGADSANCTAAPRSISPHAGVGSATPSPRNVSDASARIACPRYAVSMMRYGAITFGSMCRRMMRRWRKPAARAASTYGISRIASALDRATSAARGIIGIAIAMITLTMPVPRIDTTARARMISGNARKMSITRCTNKSTLPAKYALATPITAPIVAPRNAHAKPTSIAVREP